MFSVKNVLLASFILILAQTASFSQCNEFTSDKNMISIRNMRYNWSAGSNLKSIESISYELNNGTDLAVTEVNLKITIKDPKGKILYQGVQNYKPQNANGFLWRQVNSETQRLFFNKPLKSNWTFEAATHPLTFEILSIDYNKKSTVEILADFIDDNMKYCSEEIKARAYKFMRQVCPDILSYKWKDGSSIKILLENNIEYFDDNKMLEFTKNKMRLDSIKHYDNLAWNYYNSNNYRLALQNFLNAIKLRDTTSENEKKDNEFNLVPIAECYEKVGEYEKSADIFAQCCAEAATRRDQIARSYLNSKSYKKGIDFFRSILHELNPDFTINKRFLEFTEQTDEDWKNYKLFVDKMSNTQEGLKYELDYNVKHLAYLDYKKQRIIKPKESTFYKITFSQNGSILGFVEIELYSLENVEFTFQERFNNLVIDGLYNGSIVYYVDSSKVVCFGKSEALSNICYDSHFSPGGRLEKGSLWAFRNVDHERQITPFLIYAMDNSLSTYDRYNFDRNYKIGRILSGNEIFEKICKMKKNERDRPSIDVKINIERIFPNEGKEN